MYRKDYIQRQFEEFGKVLAQLLSLRKLEDWSQFEKEMEEALRRFSDTEINGLLAMDHDAFIQKIVLPTTLTPEQKKMMARLLFEKLESRLAQVDERDCADLAEKCLLLYEHLQRNLTTNEFDLDIYYKLEFLKNLKLS